MNFARKTLSAQGCLGRLRNAKGLAENESNMADNANCLHAEGVEIGHLLNTFERPVHESVLLWKRICAKQNCITQRAFFDENGIVQHFRHYYKEFIARVQSMAFAHRRFLIQLMNAHEGNASAVAPPKF